MFLDIPKEIKDAVSEIEAELVIPEEPEWARSQPNVMCPNLWLFAYNACKVSVDFLN